MKSQPTASSNAEIPMMVPDRDDIAARRGATAKAGGQPPAPAKRSSLLLFGLSYLLLLTGLVAVGYYQWQHNRLLQGQIAQLQTQTERMTQQLTVTDESFVNNEAALRAQMSTMMSEIRKLWDVANKRNKQWINDNQTSLAEQAKQFEQLNTTLTQLKQQLTTATDEQNSHTQQLSEMQTQLQQAQTQLQRLAQQDVHEKVLTLSVVQEDIEAQQITLQQKVADIARSIEAINASRVEFAKRLSALQQQLDAGPSAAPSQPQ